MGHSLVALASVHSLRRFIRLHAKARVALHVKPDKMSLLERETFTA
jgi:hypothetical protein